MLLNNNTLLLERSINSKIEELYKHFENNDDLRLKTSFKVIKRNGHDYILYDGLIYCVNLKKLLCDYVILGFNIKQRYSTIEIEIDYKDLDIMYKIDNILYKRVLKKEQ